VFAIVTKTLSAIVIGPALTALYPSGIVMFDVTLDEFIIMPLL
jgi:hypothetical protein